MKTSIALVAVAGFAAAASAQNFSLSIAGAPATVDTTAGAVTITIDIIGNSDFGTHMLGGSFAVNGSGTGSALVSSMSWAAASWSAFNTDGGNAGGGSYNAVIFGQLVIPGVPPFDVPAAGSELGNAIGSFQIVIAQGTGILDLSLEGQSPFSLEVLDLAGGTTANSTNGQLTLNGASINIIPAPSAMALLGLGGLVAGRRRR